MDNLRNLFAKLRNGWNNFRHSVQSCVNYDYDRCLDLIKTGGVIDPDAGPERWKRNCLILFRLLGFYQFIVALVKVRFEIAHQDDLVGLGASLMLVLSLTKCLVDVHILHYYDKVVVQLRTFLRSNTAHSGDPNFDANIRRNAAQIAGKVTMTMIFLFCCNQVLVLIPSAPRDRILGVPKQLQALGILAADVLQVAFVLNIIIFWGCRYYYSSILVLPLLMGLRDELKIVALAYDTIEDRVQAEVSEDQNKVVGASQQLPTTNASKWKHLKQILGSTLEQHVEVLRNIQLVQPIVNYMYAVANYTTMVIVSLLVFVVIRGGISVIMAVMALFSGVCIVVCYFWCHLVDSIEEVVSSANA